MSTQELLDRMRAALEDERAAIRRFDAEAVTRATAVKEDILEKLLAAPASERDVLTAGLRELKGDLRRNLVLLAHARDYLRDAIELCVGGASRSRIEAKL